MPRPPRCSPDSRPRRPLPGRARRRGPPSPKPWTTGRPRIRGLALELHQSLLVVDHLEGLGLDIRTHRTACPRLRLRLLPPPCCLAAATVPVARRLHRTAAHVGGQSDPIAVLLALVHLLDVSDDLGRACRWPHQSLGCPQAVALGPIARHRPVVVRDFTIGLHHDGGPSFSRPPRGCGRREAVAKHGAPEPPAKVCHHLAVLLVKHFLLAVLV
mmetsp:Transcript_109319/g.352933  ORF Transcript_109319/g.352933 Transcript_109319/m.352933 type:complete len:214 (-) Transcript_109319:1761-2402(-)